MRFAFTEEQQLFQKSVRECLARTCTASDLRDAWNPEKTGRSSDRLRALSELGVMSALVPEAHGGLSMKMLDVMLPLEECGRAALPEPIVESAIVAAPLLTALGGALAERWLPAIARGDAIVTVGLSDAPFVVDAHLAELLLLQRGDAIHAFPKGEFAFTREASVDGARRLFRVSVEATKSTCVAEGDHARALGAAAFDRGALATAAMLIGLSRRMLDMTVDYVKVRKQFGAPIGSFQAVKHHLADALLAVELAAPLVSHAAYVEADTSMHPMHVSMAKARASDAAHVVSRAALQCHGAIGYSFEHDLHLFMKRAWALSASYGDSAFHRARVGRALGI